MENSLCEASFSAGQAAAANQSQSKTPSSSFCKATTTNIYRSGSARPTPGKKPKTPIGDRFIPLRSAMRFDIAHYKIVTEGGTNACEGLTTKELEYRRALSMCLTGCDIDQARILAYKKKAPPAPEGYQNELRVLYDQGRRSASAKKTNRHIPSNPERILDAPEIINDYYLNLLDWSSKNVLAVGLNDHLYLWNANNGKVELLMQLQAEEQYIASLSWIEDGNYLAVGTSTGSVELWDVKQQKRIRIFNEHSSRVGALSWNQYVLTTGSRNGKINNHDVRVQNHLISSLNAHTQEICGLRWSPNGRYLASGGNDNLVNIWPSVNNECHPVSKPIYSLNQHTSAVKALAWCPWQTSILATGGGTSDRTIKFWSCNTGECISSNDSKSQVCSLLWSSDYKEIISGHGYANNQLIIWKYPKMTKVTELMGHTERILHMAMSPTGEMVVSASADETLRLWKCFTVDKSKAKNDKPRDPAEAFFKTIR